MHTLDTIKARRAVKHYDPTFEMPQTDIDRLLEHMLESPTSFNIQHWRIVNVQDPVLRQQIRTAAWDQAQVSDASLLFVLCADIKAWEKEAQRYWQQAPTATQEMLVPMIHDFYHGKEQLQRDEALRSVGILAQTTMLAAKSMGYDSCPMIGFDSDKVAELINLPQHHLVGMMIPIGKAIEAAWPKGGQLPLSDILVQNQFT